MRLGVRTWLVMVPMVALFGCKVSEVLGGGGGGGGPVAGELTFNLTTPHVDDGAVRFTVTATGSNSLTSVSAACASCQLFWRSASDTEYRGVVTGTLGAGPLVRVGVSDTGSPGDYSIQVNAAASTTFVIRSTGGYGLAPA